MPRWHSPTILTYHEVLPGVQVSRYSVTLREFAQHLLLFGRLKAQTGVEPRLTFDDGHVSNILHALPLLQEYDFKATFFITVGRIGVGEQNLAWSQVKNLAADGHAIQAHGWSHKFMPDCSDGQLRQELTYAKACIEDKLGRAVSQVSMPGGRVNERVLRYASEAGYSRAYVSTPWTFTVRSFGFEVIGRVMVRSGMSLRLLEGLIQQTPIARGSVRSEDFVRTSLKLLLGEALYHRAWRLAARRSDLIVDSSEFLKH